MNIPAIGAVKDRVLPELQVSIGTWEEPCMAV